MAYRTNLDMDVLRTFVTGFELGSFTLAADRLGRSQSAVSTQLRKLEEQVGEPLVRKAGRGLALTPAGEALLSYAKRILELNDEALHSVRGAEIEGWVRLGLPQDFAEAWLPETLGRFACAHPKVRVEVRAERNTQLLEKCLKGELDLCLAWGDGTETPHAQRIGDLPMIWVGRPDWAGYKALQEEPLPLVGFEPPCIFRSAGIAALDAAGIPWRLVFTSPSLAGLWAAVSAGLGVTMRTPISLPSSLCALDPGIYRLPPLPRIGLSLHRSEHEPSAAVSRLAQITLETIQHEMAQKDIE